MKLILSALILVSMSSPAFANFRIGWERPVQTATLKVLQTQGNFQNLQSVTLTLTKQDGSTKATGFVANIGGDKIPFTISSIQTDNCNVITYNATQKFPVGVISEGGTSLVVADWSKSPCEIALPYGTWLVTLYHYAFGAALGKASLAGQPTAVITPQ